MRLLLSAHIICDREKFVRIDEIFDSKNHIIELAGCSRQRNVVIAWGDAKISLFDSTGRTRDIILKSALHIPSYK